MSKSDAVVLAILLPNSRLRREVKEGLAAVDSDHRRNHFHEDVKELISDSLDIDKNLAKGREEENRWDYLVGISSPKSVIAIEPHSAKTEEISVVIRKKEKAREQLREHLAPSARISKWIWVSSGKNGFADTERVRRQLDQKGIEFVGSMIMIKHLPTAGDSSVQRKKRR